jgi:hypothetical protein
MPTAAQLGQHDPDPPVRLTAMDDDHVASGQGESIKAEPLLAMFRAIISGLRVAAIARTICPGKSGWPGPSTPPTNCTSS